MSSGFICDCDDPRHTFDPRSAAGVLGITNRCRNYAVNQKRGGLCPRCEYDQHYARLRDEEGP